MKDFGIILVDKPSGISSFGVVHKIRKITGIKKVGHTGTLDPFASGLLPICVGKATRLAGYILAGEKEYIANLKLGIKTDTADLTGEIIETSELPELDEAKLAKLKEEILHITEQIPPKYSAIKIDGKRAYKMARDNQAFEMKPRKIKIVDFKILQFDKENIQYRARVSKGTYIRTLSETIAEKLGSVGTTTELRRIGSGNMNISDSIELDKLDNENWKSHLADLTEIFCDYKKLILSDGNIENFCHGRRFFVDFPNEENALIVNYKNQVFGFANINERKVQPKIVLR